MVSLTARRRITLKDSVSSVNPPTVPSQGIASSTTVLDGVTISPNSIKNNNTTASNDRYEMSSQNKVSGVTPANINLEGVTRLEGVTPAAQTNSETNQVYFEGICFNSFNKC